MKVSDFNYELPDELIAQKPVEPRDSSRLMVVDTGSGSIEHHHFYNLPQFLRPNDVLVINESRVLPARLFGAREDTQGRVEVLLLHPVGEKRWEVLVKPGRRCRVGTRIVIADSLSATVVSETNVGGRIVEFEYVGDFEAILESLGETPLPPYIKAKLEDKERYQTIYAKEKGSAAAPTAGLHFTPALLEEIKQMGVKIVPLILHVGLGTFRPVKSEHVEEHRMHSEYYRLSKESAAVINQRRAEGGRVIAVGTTVVRTLETLAESGKVKAGSGWTDIFIYPGYQFEVVDGIITNFHLPQSSLLMLVSAFAGSDLIKEAYKTAVQNRYRFFSFGDAMLLADNKE
ncbi:MAG: tRNA preQ1(34) S-adenosylmethionine ribosyltransferase-isomerase QueA [Candidatus Wallacebacter cryptica]|jgi:S-adenosylmethionine:tRNA ribosyltransferase-isomerase|nr:tRNA preQ1(34) S-adenosylmethionine ribosyltransferase-isomerase QueA [Bacillota bacterium]